jgi:Domain of unknown function (DUF4350)
MSTPMNRDLLLRVLMAALALGAGVWVASCTEWVEVDVPRPPRGEAAKNPLYVTQQLVRRLGATVATPSSLSTLPPPRATLLLTSWYWDLFPERAQRLKGWVETGGHLVLYANNLDHQQLKGWLPISQLAPPRKTKPVDEEDQDEEAVDDEGDPGSAADAALRRLGLSLRTPCQDTVEPETVPASYADGGRRFKICSYVASGWKLQSSTLPLWALEGRDGPMMLRAARGQGQITVILPTGLLENERVLKGDNGLAAVAALQARPGAQVWFVGEEARAPLLSWLWQQAWVVVLLGAAALLLALWRGARRFGPLAAEAPAGRRSMAEQISGTAQFLRRQGPEALLAAQIRALDTAARGHVRGYDTLDRTQRAAAIAQHTGLDAAALGLALDKSLARKRVDLPATLELLETARRVLAQRNRTPRPSSRP